MTGVVWDKFKIAIVLHVIGYGKKQEKNGTNFQISTCPAPKITCQGNMTSGISEPLYEYVLQDVDDSESLADLLKQKLSEKTVDEIQLAQHSRIKEFREKMKSMFDSGKIRK